MFKKIIYFIIPFLLNSSSINSYNLRSENLYNTNNFDINKFDGSWIQTESNYYVQSTSEIDWWCINIECKSDGNKINITKSPYIHYIYYNPFKLENSYIINDNNNNKIIFNGTNSLELRQYGPVIDNKYDYSILTGLNNISLYVWMRDYSRYDEYKDEINDLLTSWNYTTNYKKPISVINSICL